MQRIGSRLNQDGSHRDTQNGARRRRDIGVARKCFEKGAPLQGPVVNIDAQIVGQRVNLAFGKIGADPKALKKYPLERGVKRDYPYAVEIGDARTTLKSFEQEGRRLRLSVDKPFETRFLDFDMIVNTIYIYH